MAIDKQLEYFNNNKEEILKKYSNQIIVISPDLKISSFDSPEEGYNYGVKEYGYGNFMLKDCRGKVVSQMSIISPIYMAL